MVKTMFGSSGIRGIANEEITPQLALSLGLAIGGEYPRVVVGHDPRVSSEMIEHAIIAGLLSAGSEVIKVGLVPTPTLALASKHYGCGVAITASHNPPMYNGIKIFKEGRALNTKEQDKIADIIKKERFRYASWEKTGNIGVTDVLKEHSEVILRNTGKASLRVVVDCGCGAASLLTPYILREMGCEVITLNSQLDGHFPGRHPEPTNETLGLLKSIVKNNADLGIAHDGDGDRMVAVDDKGVISGDKMLAFFALREAKKAIAIPVDASKVIEDLLNVKISRTRVGDVYVAEELIRIKGEFGGEASGAFIFPRISYCPDGIYAAARLVEIVEKEGKLSELIDTIPEYPVRRGAFLCQDKSKAMKVITEELKKLGEINTIDGVRVDLEDGWVLVRPSGTEPKIRITVESKTGCDELYTMVEGIVKKAIA